MSNSHLDDELEVIIKQLRAELITRTGELQTMSEEKAALQAMVNDLRDAIETYNIVQINLFGDAPTELEDALEKTPAQSLADRER